ncbi:cell division control protein 15, CDC15, putative [Entamoeba dispar SAW760]|uniref:non-specific serine/threonine protein kinase n=1 Tax=Entamoeba dispar (strain ATCC PRA-260 / SAW760) TaxID=370354 RepID=B0EBJ8_ENTDS|nr:cell division control protein 15, CDC15, putative [Entamoeba dispar SAW760]EDR28105.1 cell division control protein 15, CDC15, putative [Entamoeba dispar SAW760]|eukprot:EDR28105.1 cell division control protein 15, CDC15, putative [Entamoeba dispar SAW760]
MSVVNSNGTTGRLRVNAPVQSIQKEETSNTLPSVQQKPTIPQIKSSKKGNEIVTDKNPTTGLSTISKEDKKKSSEKKEIKTTTPQGNEIKEEINDNILNDEEFNHVQYNEPTDDDYDGIEKSVRRKQLNPRKPLKGKKKVKKLKETHKNLEEKVQDEIQKQEVKDNSQKVTEESLPKEGVNELKEITDLPKDIIKELKEIKEMTKEDEVIETHANTEQTIKEITESEIPPKRKQLGGKKKKVDEISDIPKRKALNPKKSSKLKNCTSSSKEDTTTKEKQSQTKIPVKKQIPSDGIGSPKSPRSNHIPNTSVSTLPAGHQLLMDENEVKEVIPQLPTRITIDKPNVEEDKKETNQEGKTTKDKKEKDETEAKLKKEKRHKKNKKYEEVEEEEGDDPMVTKQLIVKTDNERSVFSIANSIGRGAYGEVFQGMNADSGEFVAIKQMKVNKKSVMKEVMEEIRLLKKLKHKHIVRYIASTESHGFLYIIMEYMESGSLLNIVKKFNHLNESLSAKYIHQVLDGLAFIHDQGIVHRDIKAANILVAKDGSVKIADFGVSVQMNGNEKQEGGSDEDPIGTPNWMAPEVIQMQGTTVKADIWALGCTIIELITGNPPYYDLNPTAALYKIVNDDYPPFPSTVSVQLKDFLFSCFKRNPNQRASSRELLKHKWFITNGIKVVEEVKKTNMKTISYMGSVVDTTADWGNDFIFPSSKKESSAIDISSTGTNIDDWDSDFGSFSSTTLQQPSQQNNGTSTLNGDDWDNDFNFSPIKNDDKKKSQTSLKVENKTDDWGADFSFPEDLSIQPANSDKKTNVNDDDWGDAFTFPTESKTSKLTQSSSGKTNNSKDISGDDWGDDFGFPEDQKDGKTNTTKGIDDWGDDFINVQEPPKRKTLAGRNYIEQTLKKDTVNELTSQGKQVIVAKKAGGKEVAIGVDVKQGGGMIDKPFLEEVPSFDDIDALDTNDEAMKKKKEKFINKLKESAKLIESITKETPHKLEILIDELFMLSEDSSFTDLSGVIHSVGLFSILAVLEKEEFINCFPLRVKALQLINSVMGKNSMVRMNIVLSGCQSIVNFGLSHGKSNDSYMKELIKFIQCIMSDETNKYQLAQMFINCGGLSLFYQVLTLKYDGKHQTTINIILEVISKFVHSQSDIKTRIDFCSRNIITLLFIKYKVIEGLLQFVIQTFVNKQYDASLHAITILIQIIDAVLRNETQIKLIVCQKIVTTDLLGTLWRNMDSSNIPKGESDDGKDYISIQEDVLFNVCKLCKILMTDSDSDTITTLLNAKIIFFIVKVLFRCDAVDPPDSKKNRLKFMMRNGLINNVTQCLDMLCSSLQVKYKVCLELSSYQGIFVLLKNFCIYAKSNSKIIEENSFNIIIDVSRSLTKQQSSSDFITNNALEFLINYSAGNVLRPHVFAAFRALYESNKKKGLKLLSEAKCVLHLLNAFKRCNFADGICASELRDFCSMLNDHDELTLMYSKTTFLRGTAMILKSVPCDLIETKKNFAMLLKSLIKANPKPSEIQFKEKVLVDLEETMKQSEMEGKFVIVDIVEECIALILEPKKTKKNEKKHKKEEISSLEEKKKKDDDESKTKIPTKTSPKGDNRAHRRGVSFGKFGNSGLFGKHDSNENSEDRSEEHMSSSKQDRKVPPTPETPSSSSQSPSSTKPQSPCTSNQNIMGSVPLTTKITNVPTSSTTSNSKFIQSTPVNNIPSKLSSTSTLKGNGTLPTRSSVAMKQTTLIENQQSISPKPKRSFFSFGKKDDKK